MLLLTKGDSFSYHKGQQFTTFDYDNDQWSANCAISYKGAWWYTGCYLSNLNGHYYFGQYTSNADGIKWHAWTGHSYSMRFTEMKVRPITF